jgi:hypothetical protein
MEINEMFDGLSPEAARMMAKLAGVDYDAFVAKRKQDFIDYCHLLSTMTPGEFGQEIAKAFAPNDRQAAILCLLAARLCELEEKGKG